MFVERFYNPEKLLRLRLRKNPVYPFTELEENVYVLTHTPRPYIVPCVMCAVAVLIALLLLTVGRSLAGIPPLYLVIPILMFLFFFPRVFAIRGPRTLLIDFNHFSYEVCNVCIMHRTLLSCEKSIELFKLPSRSDHGMSLAILSIFHGDHTLPPDTSEHIPP